MKTLISKELCDKLDLPIERWGTIRRAIGFYCDGADGLLRETAMEAAEDDEDFRICDAPLLEFTDVCETELPE